MILMLEEDLSALARTAWEVQLFAPALYSSCLFLFARLP
jgi:hypothetical protein